MVHTVCVCTIHQNVKLMLKNTKLDAITNGEFKTYKHCVVKLLHNPPEVRSITCDTEVRAILEKSFEENCIEKIMFRQWISVDHCNLGMLQKLSTEFIDLFCDKLSILIRHDFISNILS